MKKARVGAAGTGLSRRALLHGAAALVVAGSLPAGVRAATTRKKEMTASHNFTGGDLIRYVNPLQGTDSHPSFSRGNTLPLVARPFGMTHWSPQTGEGSWFFQPNTHTLRGIRATHQPSPWMGDYGHFTVMPQAGEPALEQRDSGYRPEDLTVQPHYLSVQLQRGNVHLEMTPTERCAVYRFTFPTAQASRVFITLPDEAQAETHPERRLITGHTRVNNGGVPDNYAFYFAALFDQPLAQQTSHQEGKALVAVAEFASASRVEMRVGTSFISAEQALENLRHEVGAKSFDAIKAEGEGVWEDVLGKVQIAGGTETQLRTFYSCLYRAHLFPRMFHEHDAQGKTVHYSPYDGKVHEGVLYTDNGFWDTYRTVYPLLALLQPERLGEIIQGWVNTYKEGGWFPQWPSPGYRACMIGTHIDIVVADACVRGITGFDRETAYAGMVKHATIPGDSVGNYGRLGIEDYLAKGYVAADKLSHATSRTLDYAYDDFCLAQVADLLGHPDDVAKYRQRALNYKHVYDPGVGFMRGKNADGSWEEPFDEFAWGDPYIEGGAWQSTWAVQHDPAGLIGLMGGAEKFVGKLDKMLSLPPTFHVGSYGGEIHEMTEMARADFGQYAHSNQPVHHVLFLYTAAGRPDKTQYWVRRILDTYYTPDSLPGDEDNGEMCSWYVLNALGFYPLCPGHPSYVFGSPLFPAARVHLPGGKTLTVTAENNAPESVYVQHVTLNDRPHRPLWVSHHDLAQGGHLQFTMGSQPVEKDYSQEPDSLPPSLSRYGR